MPLESAMIETIGYSADAKLLTIYTTVVAVSFSSIFFLLWQMELGFGSIGLLFRLLRAINVALKLVEVGDVLPGA